MGARLCSLPLLELEREAKLGLLTIRPCGGGLGEPPEARWKIWPLSVLLIPDGEAMAVVVQAVAAGCFAVS